MSREDDLKVLYTSPPLDPKIVAFNNIAQPCPLLALLTIQDIQELNRIAKDKKLNTEPKKKLNMIKDIMGRRGFKKLASGTNRIVFKYMENQSFVIKVAYDSVGLSDNLCEIYNQHFLKPFCTKVFEVSPCGTVGMFERVRLIKNREEFFSIASEIYDIIIMELLGKYVLADFGSKFFMNWGIRQGMHPVLLDFPYCYELDGAKLYCNSPNPVTGFCGGEIDYDDGFNHLICTKCGKQYQASELKTSIEGKSDQIMVEKEDIGMIVEIIKDEKVVRSIDTTKTSNTYRKKETPYEYRKRKKFEGVVIEVVKGEPKTDENQKPERREPHQVISTEALKTPLPNVSEDQFNNGWSSREVPSVDGLYKDTEIEVTQGDPKKRKTKWKGKINVDTETDNIQWPNSQKTFSEPVKDAEVSEQSEKENNTTNETQVHDTEKEFKELTTVIETIAKKVANGEQQPNVSNNEYQRARELVDIIFEGYDLSYNNIPQASGESIVDYSDNDSQELEPEYNEDYESENDDSNVYENSDIPDDYYD